DQLGAVDLHAIHVAAADRLAHGALGGVAQGLLRVHRAEQVHARILAPVLGVELDVDEVLVAGQYPHLVGDLDHLGGVDHAHGFNRPGPLEVRARVHDPVELAEAQHHATLALVHQLEAVEHQPDRDDGQDPGHRIEAAGRLAIAAAPAAAAEHALEPGQEGIDLVAGVLALPGILIAFAGGVPGHACSVSRTGRGCGRRGIQWVRGL